MRADIVRWDLELIGHPPVVAHGFDVEATAEGRFDTQQLAWRGLVLEGDVESPGE